MGIDYLSAAQKYCDTVLAVLVKRSMLHPVTEFEKPTTVWKAQGQGIRRIGRNCWFGGRRAPQHVFRGHVTPRETTNA